MRRYAKRPGSFDWDCKEPELMWYATAIGTLWLKREMHGGGVTADILNKACGILSEEIFSADLNQLDVPHVRTVPLLSKAHPVNLGKPYDLKIQDVTIDVKAIPPIPLKPEHRHHKNLNLNKPEVDENGACDLYVVTKDYPELDFESRPSKYDVKAGIEFATKILEQVKSIEFLGWATKEEIIQKKNLSDDSSYYKLRPPFHSMQEFAAKFHIPLEPAT